MLHSFRTPFTVPAGNRIGNSIGAPFNCVAHPGASVQIHYIRTLCVRSRQKDLSSRGSQQFPHNPGPSQLLLIGRRLFLLLLCAASIVRFIQNEKRAGGEFKQAFVPCCFFCLTGCSWLYVVKIASNLATFPVALTASPSPFNALATACPSRLFASADVCFNTRPSGSVIVVSMSPLFPKAFVGRISNGVSGVLRPMSVRSPTISLNKPGFSVTKTGTRSFFCA